eukprot:CAMPEP_0113503922 /NCGR_PEP_ID=MMETSP0014_2-20120614/34438_1 /TAXON_ID=2857 /ORGANISM="Nitzschia sp." /LENGTH=294 /DNA_ID=CAMNT_0000398993 /DNA_START=141 /DNA_END=1022 /DNA_ORIENTATION=+ /assembly_acc=CAM_ASM_000159
MHRYSYSYSYSYSEKNIVFVSCCLLLISLLSQDTTTSTTTTTIPVVTAFVPSPSLPQSPLVSSSHNHLQDSSIIHDKRNVLSVLKSTPSGDNDRKAAPSAPVSSTSTSKPLKTGDFEYQELKIQLKAMKDQDVTSSRLDLPKRVELDGYVKRVVNRRPSPIAMQDVGQHLPGTSWRLAFSTESFLTQTLPKDSTITLNFFDNNTNNNNSQKVDYAIEFPKTLALKRLVAKSSYTVSTSPVDAGLVQINYDSISTDIFGFQNIGVGMFGMLQGRSTFIPTVYFDGDIWIERGVDP